MDIENRGAAWRPIWEPPNANNAQPAQIFHWNHYAWYLVNRDVFSVNLAAITLLYIATVLGYRVIHTLSSRNNKVFTNQTMTNGYLFGGALLALSFGLGGTAILKATCSNAIEIGRAQMDEALQLN